MVATLQMMSGRLSVAASRVCMFSKGLIGTSSTESFFFLSRTSASERSCSDGRYVEDISDVFRHMRS